MLLDAGKTSAVVMFLVAAALVSSWLITIAELPLQVSDDARSRWSTAQDCC
jgi:TRAP-type transport system large permease protein